MRRMKVAPGVLEHSEGLSRTENRQKPRSTVVFYQRSRPSASVSRSYRHPHRTRALDVLAISLFGVFVFAFFYLALLVLIAILTTISAGMVTP